MNDPQVQDIKDKLSINEVVGQYITLRRAGRNFVAQCPFHKERTPSFHVSPERGSYMCFGCGEKGDIFSFVQKMDGVDFVTALKQLAKQAAVELKPRQLSGHIAQDKNKEERLFEVCEAATVFFESILKNRKDVQDYLHARGVHDDTIASWRIGYAPASWRELSEHLLQVGFTKEEIIDAGLAAKSDREKNTELQEIRIYDRFRGRIMFPLFDAGGKVIAFSGRIFEEMPAKTSSAAGSLHDNSQSEVFSAKYVNSPETALFKKSRVLYGYDRAKNAIRKHDCILLVEGQFDVILSHQSGLPFTVAISGTALTPEHLSLLGRISHRLVLALDGDAAGIRAGLKSSAMALAQGFDVKIPTFEGGKDPADLAKENPELLKAAVRTSKTAVEFFLEALRRGAKDERAYKTLVQNQLLPLVHAMPSRIDQAHFISVIAQRLGVPEDAVRVEVAKARSVPLEDSEESIASLIKDDELTPLERSTGMLLFRFESDDTVQTKLEDLLGKERVAELKKKLQDQAERLRFEFDALGSSLSEVSAAEEEVARVEALLQSVEKIIIEEEMREVRQKLYSGDGEELRLGQKLAELKRREQQLRK